MLQLLQFKILTAIRYSGGHWTKQSPFGVLINSLFVGIYTDGGKIILFPFPSVGSSDIVCLHEIGVGNTCRGT